MVADVGVKIHGESDLDVLMRKTNAQFKELEKRLGSVSRASVGGTRRLNGLTSANRNMGFAVQNAGFQIQDIIVQLNSGTSAARAFGQQIPQLLQPFGLMGVIAGTVAAALIPLGARLFSTGKEASDLGDRISDLASAVSAYQSAVKDAQRPTDDLAKEFGAMASEAERFFDIQKRLKEFAAFDALQTAQQSIAGLSSAMANLTDEQAVAASESIRLMAEQRNRPAIGPAFPAFDVAQKVIEDYDRILAVAGDLNVMFGVTEQQAGRLIVKFGLFRDAQGLQEQVEAANDLADALLAVIQSGAELSEEGQAARDQILEFIEKGLALLKLSGPAAADDAIKRFDGLAAAVDAFAAASERARTANDIASDGAKKLAVEYGGLTYEVKGLLEAEKEFALFNVEEGLEKARLDVPDVDTLVADLGLAGDAADELKAAVDALGSAQAPREFSAAFGQVRDAIIAAKGGLGELNDEQLALIGFLNESQGAARKLARQFQLAKLEASDLVTKLALAAGNAWDIAAGLGAVASRLSDDTATLRRLELERDLLAAGKDRVEVEGALAAARESDKLDAAGINVPALRNPIIAQARDIAEATAAARAAIADLTKTQRTAGGGAREMSAAQQIATQAMREAQKAAVSFEEVQAILTVAVDNGALSQEEYTAALDIVRERLVEFSKEASGLGEVLKSAFSSAESAFRSFVDGGKISFKGLIRSIMADLATLQFRTAVLTPLANALSGVFGGIKIGGNANGNAFAGGNVIPFARGGVVSAPTLFPMARGIGLMGEAGPEAVMPLRRIGGRLGVEAAGGGGQSRIVVELSPDLVARVVAQARQDSVQITQIGLAEFERDMQPRNVQAIASDPRRRG